ncbi:hypothetical protein MRB53_002473 [Persea americana]|uniref:Uncharacterized protein n=1 Tax=Persea americana TaxID=3435 RepID=A0ACC2MUQ4_PERAE|nr:hypothetical protein MRB53_002473 [Persea americana]
MVLSRVPFGAFVLFSVIFDLILSMIQAQSLAPAPAPASDGMSIDQGVAYMLMLIALVLTYLIHPIDVSSFPYKLF